MSVALIHGILWAQLKLNRLSVDEKKDYFYYILGKEWFHIVV